MYAHSIKQGIRQIERWMIAAVQDQHPGIKLLHSNYAVGNIDMLAQQFTHDQIKAVTGKDVRELYLRATQLQDEAQQQLANMCPEAMPTY